MRPGAGRKPKAAKERLRNRVMFALADDEYENLEKARGDEPLSAFVRRIVLRYLARRQK